MGGFHCDQGVNAKERRRRLRGSPRGLDDWSTRGQQRCTHRVRATVTVFSRHIVFSDWIARIPEFSDRIVLQSQLE